jgi:uncharacterized protein
LLVKSSYICYSTPMNMDTIKSKIATLATVYNLDMVVLFGSQVTGKTHAESDVDIAYYSDTKLDFNQEVSLNTDLIDVFRNDNVSLVNLKTASPLLAKEVVSKGVVLYATSPSLFSQVYAYVLRIYEEARPLFELRRHYLDYKIEQYRHA